MRAQLISRRRVLGACGGAAFLVAAPLLSACGATPGPTPPPAKAAAPAPTTAAAPTPAAPAPTTAPAQPTTAPAQPTAAAASGAPSPVPAAATKPAVVNTTITFWHMYFQPTEWETRSAEHPTVSNALRILGKRFEQENPGVKVNLPTNLSLPNDEAYTTWLTARVASGDAPEVISPIHDIPIQKGWCVPLDQYLTQANPYAPKSKSWRDVFYPSLMKSLVYGDGKTYAAPLAAPFPQMEIGLAINLDTFDKHGLKFPSDAAPSWSDMMDAGKKLKESGDGIAPWPVEAKTGNVWALALQILPSMLREMAPKLDLNGDAFIPVEEGLPAFRAGLIGPRTTLYQTAWKEMRRLSSYWIDGWSTTDVDLAWRQGKAGIRYAHTRDYVVLDNDPQVKFRRQMLPAATVTAKDIPGASDPDSWTKGDGKIPGELVTAVNGPDTSILKGSTDKNGNFDAALKWLQFIAAPEQIEFIVNENEARIPSAVDAKLGPIWSKITTFKLPLRKYTIAWYGQGLFFDATQFTNMRKLFMAWVTEGMDDKTFFERQHQEASEGADRYEAALKKLQEKK